MAIPLRMGALALLAGALWACGADADLDEPPPPSADAGAIAMDAGLPYPAVDASVPGRDAGTGDACDPVLQSGCASAAKCVVEGPAGAGARCVDASAEGLPRGATCEGLDCAPGLACARATRTSTAGECVQVCDYATGAGCEALGPDFECRTRLGGTDWGACVELPPTCDPYTQAPCEGGEACQRFLRRTGTWELRCQAAGRGEGGAPCGTTSNESCARGFACVATPAGAAFCRRICQTNADCANMAQCNGVVSDPYFTFCTE